MDLEWSKKKFEKYIGKQVTLELTNDKKVSGKMTAVYDDSIDFQSKEKKVSLPFNKIRSVSPAPWEDIKW